MSNKYLICIDAACDLEKNILDKEDIRIIPMDCTLNNQTISWKIQDYNLTKEFYNAQRNGDLTKTTLINPFSYQQYFEPLLKEGNDILYLSLSSGLSSTYQSSLTALSILKSEYPAQKIISVDSLSATGVTGLLLLRAIQNRNNGASIEENEKDLLEYRYKLGGWFMVQDLQYLKRGGRISATTAFVGGVLGVMPILVLDTKKGGVLETISKQKGKKRGLEYLLNRFEENYDGNSDIYLVDSDETELVTYLKDKIVSKYPNAVIHHTPLSPIIGAHTGPGMVAIVCATK